MKREKDEPARILIVDDEALNRKLLGNALEREHTINFAGNGDKAIAIARQWQPDLIVLDVIMPGVDGFQVCEQLKADKKTAAITVLFITAMNDAINEEQGFARGAVDYIHKPISTAVVRARVRVHLNILHYTKFLERLAARQTNDLERAKEEARQMLTIIKGLKG